MAQTTAQIKQEINEAIAAEPIIAALDNTSIASPHGLFSYIVAFVISKVQGLFDTLRAEVLDLLAKLKPHSLRWYAEKFKAFQYGFALPADTDKYDNTGFTDDQVALSKIIKYAAVVEQVNPFGRTFLRAKLATSNGGDLMPLSLAQLNAVKSYIARVKDAGVTVITESLSPDKLKNKWVIYYDPLVLSATGARLDGTANEPVRDAIKEYLKNLDFNGTYILAHHIDAVQKVEGVGIPNLVECYASYGALPFTAVSVLHEPDAGYLRFENDTDLIIEFLPYNVI